MHRTITTLHNQSTNNVNASVHGNVWLISAHNVTRHYLSQICHPLHPIDNRSRTGAETCGLDDVLPPGDLGSRPEALCKYICIYMYVHSLYELCYRSYIQRDCHPVLAKLHPITFYRGVRGFWSECHFVFSLVYQLCLAL